MFVHGDRAVVLPPYVEDRTSPELSRCLAHRPEKRSADSSVWGRLGSTKRRATTASSSHVRAEDIAGQIYNALCGGVVESDVANRCAVLVSGHQGHERHRPGDEVRRRADAVRRPAIDLSHSIGDVDQQWNVFFWSVVVDAGRNSAGERVRKWHSGYRTRKEAERARVELLSRLDQGTYVAPSRLTLGRFLPDEWLPAKRSTVKGDDARLLRTPRHQASRPGARRPCSGGRHRTSAQRLLRGASECWEPGRARWPGPQDGAQHPRHVAQGP